MAEFLPLGQPVIIAMKGLPCAGKSEIARCIGGWTRCPVLYIDHFLDMLSLGSGYTAELLPSPDEAERLHLLAFDRLCKAASDYLRWGKDAPYWGYKSVVVKSRLCTTFELDRLVQLAREGGCGTILIIEFQMSNEHRVRNRLEHKVESGEQKEWYKPRSWIDIEKARDDYYCLDPQANSWDLHLLRLLDNGEELPRVKRLVLDPFYDLVLLPYADITFDFGLNIRFLLRGLVVGEDVEKDDDLLLESRYEAREFGELGRYLRERKLREALSKKRGMYRCTSYSRGRRFCTFKYWEELQNDKGISYSCGVCEELVVSGQPAYTCYSCFLSLHKSCAEILEGVTLEGFKDLEFLRLYPHCDGERLPHKYACNEEHKNFSPGCMSCFTQTHLKCRVLPTILNHDCHEHFLSIAFFHSHSCKACGTTRTFRGGYGCYVCGMYYDIDCLSLLRKVEHEHGGHEHLLKLKYSHDGMEKEEDIWCGICYEDMDPQNWFYSCQGCPYYVAHPNCVRLSGFTN